MLFSLHVLLELVVQLLLVIKEEELVLEDLRAAQLGLLFVVIAICNTLQEFLVLVELHLSLSFLVHKVLTHLFQMVLQELIVSHLASKVNFLAEAD